MKKAYVFFCLLAVLLLSVQLFSCGTETHTVVFLDETGAVLKTETVEHGKNATAPAPSEREDTVFDAWDRAFDQVTEDLTVRAVYRPKEYLTVSFYDYSGRLLSDARVKELDDAIAPASPTREGYSFVGWSEDLKGIRENKKVYAKYELTEADNVFDLSYALEADGSVTLTLSVLGRVRLAGVSGELRLPNGVSGASVLPSFGSADVNLKDGSAYFVFVDAFDTTAPFPLFALSFKSEADALDFWLCLEAKNVFDQNEASIGFTVIGERVVLK